MMLHPHRGVGQAAMDTTAGQSAFDALTGASGTPVDISAGYNPTASASTTSGVMADLQAMLNANATTPVQGPGPNNNLPASGSMSTVLIFALVGLGAIVLLKKR